MRRVFVLLAGAALTMAAAPPPLATMWENTAAAARQGNLHGHLIVADAAFAHGEDVGNSTGPGLWRWASVSKQIIAVLVMQEVDRGRVTLDTPIKAYTPELQGRQCGQADAAPAAAAHQRAAQCRGRPDERRRHHAGAVRPQHARRPAPASTPSAAAPPRPPPARASNITTAIPKSPARCWRRSPACRSPRCCRNGCSCRWA